MRKIHFGRFGQVSGRGDTSDFRVTWNDGVEIDRKETGAYLLW